MFTKSAFGGLLVAVSNECVFVAENAFIYCICAQRKEICYIEITNSKHARYMPKRPELRI